LHNSPIDELPADTKPAQKLKKEPLDLGGLVRVRVALLCPDGENSILLKPALR
jgi:hypothetical protein